MPTSTGAARTGAWVGALLTSRRRFPDAPLGTRGQFQISTRACRRRPNGGRLGPMWFVRRRPLVSLVILAALIAAATTVEAQFRRGFGRGFGSVRLSTPADVDGSFQFCRIIFNGDFRGDGQGGSGTWTGRAPTSTCRSACPS